jgi:succinate dehydrogenase hydrophobic anchor subunit
MRARLNRLRTPALQAVLFFVIWASTIAVGLQLGWYPINVGNYVAVGVIAAFAILACREFPLAGLLAIGVITIFPPWFFDEPEIRMIPLVFAAYFATSRGLRPSVAVPLVAFFTLFTVVPFLAYGWLGIGAIEMLDFYPLRDPSTRVLSAVVVLAAVLVGVFAQRQTATTAKLHERNEQLQALRNSETSTTSSRTT